MKKRLLCLCMMAVLTLGLAANASAADAVRAGAQPVTAANARRNSGCLVLRNTIERKNRP